jgi:hypothetical protein
MGVCKTCDILLLCAAKPAGLFNSEKPVLLERSRVNLPARHSLYFILAHSNCVMGFL